MHDERNYNDNRSHDRRPGGGRDDRRDFHGGGQGGGRGGDRSRRGTPLSELDPALTEVSRKVIGCAIEVHMELGPGYSEEVYVNALRMELDAQSVGYKAGHTLEVYFDEKVVGTTVADLWVADRFVVKVLARPGEIGSLERNGLRAQLRAADVELGLIINFGERRLKDGLVRVLNPDKLNEMRGDEGDEAEEGEDGAIEEEAH